jgi:hypothetical protein
MERKSADILYRPSHMRRLYEICQTPTKIWKPLPGGDHNSSVLEEGYFEAIADFISNLDTNWLVEYWWSHGLNDKIMEGV